MFPVSLFPGKFIFLQEKKWISNNQIVFENVYDFDKFCQNWHL